VPIVKPGAVFGFPEGAAAAERLAVALGVPFHEIELRRFPDGESLVRVPQGTRHGAIFRALDRPNEKLVEIVLAAEALRGQGAEQVTLVAPYLPYMRQDRAFRPGEAVSQQVIGRWLADHFTTIVAVDPHLHRTDDLTGVFAGAEMITLTATGLLGEALKGAPAETLVLAPDEEAGRLAQEVAGPLGLAAQVATKTRHGDREVEIALPEVDWSGRPVVIVDDVVSTGGTLAACARLVAEAGAARIEALAVHALYDDRVAATLAAAGIARLRSCDGVPHPTNAIELAPLIADALKS
jgi:ribose-phosphate pyrophosphokinase